MNRTDSISAALRTLDPADQHIDPAGSRARTDLHAILAQDPTPTLRTEAGSPVLAVHRPRRAGRTASRVGLLGGLAAAVTAGLVVLPSLTGGDQAFATWTAAPTGMSGQQRSTAADDCRKQMKSGAGYDYLNDLGSATLAIAERRGVWTTVVLTGKEGFSALCITDDSAGLFDKGMIGSIGKPGGYAAPGPRELSATDLGMGTMGAGDISLAAGAAGPDVVAVTYRSQSHGNVTATVNAGRFALWFPGDELKERPTGWVEVQVTYRDGQTGTSRLTL